MKRSIGVRHSVEEQTSLKEDKADSLLILNPTPRQDAIAGGISCADFAYLLPKATCQWVANLS